MTRFGSSDIFRSTFSTSSTPKYNKAQEIAHLLDPSYTGQQPISSAPYLDSDGILHDPNYRYFPVLPPPPSKRRRASHSVSPFASRPPWEAGATYEQELEDEDDEYNDANLSNNYPSNAYRQYSSRSSSPLMGQRNRDFNRQRQGSSFSHATPYPSLPIHSPSLSTTPSSSSASPTLSSIHGQDVSFGEEKKRVPGLAKRYASKASFKRRSIDHVLEEKMEPNQEGQSALWMSYTVSPKPSMEMENEMNELQTAVDRQVQTREVDDESAPLEEWTPTCIEVFKYRWHLISDKFRHHAQKRSRRRARSL